MIISLFPPRKFSFDSSFILAVVFHLRTQSKSALFNLAELCILCNYFSPPTFHCLRQLFLLKSLSLPAA